MAWMEDGPEERSADVSPAETATGVARSLARDDDDDDELPPLFSSGDDGGNGDLDLNIKEGFKGSRSVSTGKDLRLWSRRRKLSSAIDWDDDSEVCPASNLASSVILWTNLPWLSRRGLIIKKTGYLSLASS